MSRNKLIAAARGDRPADIMVTNALLVDTLTKMIRGPVDIGMVGHRIAFVVPTGKFSYSARKVIDAAGRFVSPGFCDGHVHNESSQVTPANWARVIVPLGTTTVVTDPHEIGNVMGLDGIYYMLDASVDLPIRYFVTASSCVPSVPAVESAGATFTYLEIRELLEASHRVVAIAEAMDYPGVIHQGGNIAEIVTEGHRHRVPIEGHAPGVVGTLLQAYAAACGPRGSDHESWEEQLEKVRAGMFVYARGSKVLNTLQGIVQALKAVQDTRLFGFCTDDIFAADLLKDGHLNAGMKRLMGMGVDPVTVIQMSSLNVAQHYGIHGVGAIAPGWLADMLILNGRLEDLAVSDVIVDGEHVVHDGMWTIEFNEPVEPLTENMVRIPMLSEDDFRLSLPGLRGQYDVHAIDMSELLTSLGQLTVTVGEDGYVEVPEGVATVVIVPRHGQDTPPSVALGVNFPIVGAIASTVGHDSHNMVVIGNNPADMLAAVFELERAGGGYVSVRDGHTLAMMPLPIAGLMSPLPVPEVAVQFDAFVASLPKVGLPATFPFTLIALSLPVFPYIRLTDKGMVDVATQQFVPTLV